MSFEEDIQLKDLVAQTLEANGSLAKIRAQLRSSIFCALSEDEKISGLQPLMNNKIKSSLETMEDCTLSVYDPESYLGQVYEYQGRNMVAEELGLESKGDGNSCVPILLMLIRLVQLRKNDINGEMTLTNPEKIKSDDGQNTTRNLNTTFELSNPTINCIMSGNEIPEISPFRSDINNSEDNTQKAGSYNDNNCKLQSPEITSQPVVKDIRNGEKPKSDKIKPKNTLPDISCLQNNKPRGSDIFPSLYKKEYKDKSGFRELDKMFDMEAEYEEDFMYSSDLSLKCDYGISDSNNVKLDNASKSIATESLEILSNDDSSKLDFSTSKSISDKPTDINGK